MAVKNSSVPDLPFTLTGVNKTFFFLLHVCIRIFLFNRCVYSDHSFHSVGLCLSMLIFLFTQSLCIHSELSISTMCVFDHLLPNTIKLSTQKTMKQSVLNYTGMTFQRQNLFFDCLITSMTFIHTSLQNQTWRHHPSSVWATLASRQIQSRVIDSHRLFLPLQQHSSPLPAFLSRYLGTSPLSEIN